MKKHLFFAISVVVSIQLLCLPYGYAGRPLTTDDAWTVEKGVFQLEMGLDVARQDNHDKEYTPSLTLAYGLLDRMDLGIGIGYLFVRPEEGDNESGFGDMQLKLKYRLADEKEWLPALTVSGKLKIPTASDKKRLGTGEADFGINAIATKNITKRLVLHANLGYTFFGEDGANNEVNYSLGSQFVLTDKWSLVGEIVGTNNLNGTTGDDPLSALFGTYYLLTENLILDAGVEIGTNSAAPDYRLTAGFTFLFKP
jgi:hypothetical protein